MIQAKPYKTECSLPWLVECDTPGPSGLIGWYKDNEQDINEKLLLHGAILFRGFGINTPGAFARFTRSASSDLMESVEENVPRTKLTSGVYTSTEYPPEYMLSMHSEYSYSHVWPVRLFFCCIVAAKDGGETPIGDNREIIKRLDDGIVKQFEEKKVKYLRNLHNGKGFGLSWQTAFQTNDRAVVEEYCRAKAVDFEWKADGGLRLKQTFAGVVTHPRTGERAWFNQAPQFHASDYPRDIYETILRSYEGRADELPQDVRFGDDSPIDVSVLDTIRETMKKQAVAFPWQEGDVLMLDNVLVCHGRMPFVGPRKILVAMSAS